jgi:hypothetical protein
MYVNPADFKHIQHLGFVKEHASFGGKSADWRVDPVMNKAFIELDLFSHFNYQSYGRIRETHFGAFRGIMKYDGPNDNPNLDEKTLQRTLHLLFKLFSPNFDTCPETADDQVEIPLDTHPGVDYRALDFKTKGDVMRNTFGRNSVRTYYREPKFPTVWKEAVKGGELLKASKLDTGDSRVFLIPGLDFHWLCVKMLQTQHSLFLELAQSLTWPIKIGFSLQHGGFSRMMGSLEGFNLLLKETVLNGIHPFYHGSGSTLFYPCGLSCLNQQKP